MQEGSGKCRKEAGRYGKGKENTGQAIEIRWSFCSHLIVGLGALVILLAIGTKWQPEKQDKMKNPKIQAT